MSTTSGALKRRRSQRTSAASMMESLEPRLMLSGLPAMVNTGIGGSGAMFQVTVSPYDSQYVHLACDMTGDYRTINGGATWQLINFKQIDSSISLRPAFSATKTYWVDTGVNELRVSADEGNTWTKVLPGTAPWSGSITYLGAISGTPDKIFVGTASGLWQSQNGGATWTQAATGSCTGIATIGSNVYATLGATLKASIDGGLTWNTITVTGAGSHTLKRVTGAQVGTAAPYLFVIVDQVGVVRSTDGGATWSTVQLWNKQAEIQMSPGQTQMVYTCQTNQVSDLVWVSTNGGTTWTSTFLMGSNVTKSWVQTQLYWGYYITDGGMSVGADPNTVYVSTQGDLYKTTNGGATWTQDMDVSLSGNREQSIGLEVTGTFTYQWDPNNYNNQYIGYSDIGFARSTDGGSSWAWSNKSNPWSNTMYNIAFDPDVPNKLYGAASNLHEIPEWISIDSTTSSTGGVVVSTDGGSTWAKLGTGLPNQPCTDILVDPTSPPSARVLYATMYNSGVWKSSDGGATWTQKTGVGFSNNHHADHLYLAATGTLYCLVTATKTGSTFTKGGVWKSSNGGDTWQEITNAMFAWPTGLAIVDANTMYISAASGGGYSQGGAWKTVNGGATWTQVLTEPMMAAYHTPSYSQAMMVKVFPDNPNIVYCGTVSQGLWVSQDAGATWAPFTTLPFQAVMNVTFDPHDHTQIYVCTDGGGVWHGYYLPRLPGDANGDGAVTFRDYIVLEGNFGKTSMAWAQGDFNGDQKVDFKDYIILEADFNASISGALSSVPAQVLTASVVTAPLSATLTNAVVPATQEQARQFLLPSAMTGYRATLPAWKAGRFQLGKVLNLKAL